MTRDEVIKRLCALQEKVCTEVIGFDHPADCFCGHGGRWSSKSYSDADYRNNGVVLEWIEKVVTDAISQQLSAHGASL